ncbi:MAG: methyltransferase domain-containing protein [Pseudomonadales bacterium]|nr:methyltransferase domain-containing protein [Pseudomonadales bacterium]
MKTIDRTEGRRAFGHNVAGYDTVRPLYPKWMFETLAGFVDEPVTLEIGPGNGLATRSLAQIGASPITLIEPDRRFSGLLEGLTDVRGDPCQITYASFEAAKLPAHSFDLVVAATSFHWLEPRVRVEKLAGLVKPKGIVALMWHVFQDMELEDLFHEATKDLLSVLDSSPSGSPDELPFALDRQARELEFLETDLFELRLYQEERWPLRLNPTDVRVLYEGFSGIAQLSEPDRHDLLNRLETIARVEFQGQVVRNMTSPLYIFERKPT